MFKSGKCPVCNSTDVREDIISPDSMEVCDKCGSEWNCANEITLDARDYFTDKENQALGRNPKKN